MYVFSFLTVFAHNFPMVPVDGSIYRFPCILYICVYAFSRCTASKSTISLPVCLTILLLLWNFEVTGCPWRVAVFPPCQTLLHYCGISLDEEDEIKARQVLGCPPRQKSRKSLGCQANFQFSVSEKKETSACIMFQAFEEMIMRWYCWWLKSCTTWDVWNPVNHGVN